MKKKLSIDRIGTRGSIGLLIVGMFCLLFGIFLQIKTNDLPSDAVECSARIVSFQEAAESRIQSPSTLVSYEVSGVPYTQSLGQYEASWKIGDTITICCSRNDPTHIWTRTMQYRGIFWILFSFSFLTVSIYKLLQFRKIKGVNDDESDIDESGEEKFKISSFIIPLVAGVPFVTNGILYWIMEHSFLGFVVILLGITAVLTGVFSWMDYIRYKKEHPKASRSKKHETS